MKSIESKGNRPLSLPRSDILRGKRNFQRLFKEGSSLSEQHVSLRYVILSDASENNLIGFITGRRIGKAHERNYVRRRLREAYRLDQHILADYYKAGTPVFHVAFIAKTKQVDFATLQEECVRLLKRFKTKLNHHSV
ncbi:MAG: ribonuclease P protein component [Balneolales bacterium]